MTDIVDLADFVFDYSKDSSNYYLPHRIDLLTEESKESSDYKEMLDERWGTLKLKSEQTEHVKFYMFVTDRSMIAPDSEGANAFGYLVLCKCDRVVGLVRCINYIPN